MRQRFAPGIIDYNGPMAPAYNRGRALSPQAAETWRRAIALHIPQTTSLTIIDLGAGTGRFAKFLADNFAARVIGVEPAVQMRNIALAQQGPSVSFVAGTAEAIPLRDGAGDVIWMSQVLHHVRDQHRCAQELRRVVQPHGCVLVRSTFAEGLYGFPTLFRYFPGIAATFDHLPTLRDSISTFQAHGLTLETHRRIDQQICASLREFAERTRVRADSSLALLPDAEFAACQAALDTAATQETHATPVVETLDFLVLRPAQGSPY